MNMKHSVAGMMLLALLTGCASFPEHPVSHQAATPEARDQVVEIALAQLGQPYVYGGSNPGGFDCSGLVHYAYRRAGLEVPRTTSQQYRQAQRVARRNLQPGDLVFFRLRGSVSHVGLYLGDGEMIHAPSTGNDVRIEPIDERFWSNRFAGGARLLPAGHASSNGGGGSNWSSW